MGTQAIKLTVIAVGLAAITVVGLLPNRAMADSRPQAVLDLISAHQALAMKIRPLQDRFNPDAVPLRAKASAATGENTTGAERRASETLRHKDRAVSADNDPGGIKARLQAFEKNAKTERERVMRPNFGVGLERNASEIAAARKALAALRREFAALEREVNALAHR